MSEEKQFYTYLYLREDGTPFYVGKGHGKRAYVKHRNGPPVDHARILIQDHPSEQDALAAEIFLIAYYGRKDIGTGILRNLTDGGENPPSSKGKHASAATRAKMRKPKPLGHGQAVSRGRMGMVFTEEHCQHMRESRLGVPSQKVINLIGQQFGRLYVLARSHNVGVEAAWLCRCNCGTEKVIRGSALRERMTRSCGCLHRELTSLAHRKDLTGQVFGRLTAIKRDGHINNEIAWLCRCDCGKTRRVAYPPKFASTKKCGCNRPGVVCQ
jgi:hypothetical protein